MDPVIDTDENYSDFQEIDVSEYLNDPNEGFLNGGFEEGLSLWGGNQEQWGELTNYGMVEIDSGDAIVQPIEGSKYLKIKSETGLEVNKAFIQAELEFSTKELAINYAKKKKIDYELIKPKKRKIVKKSYADNFLK